MDTHGQYQYEALRQSGLFGIDVKQLSPGKHLRTADLIHLSCGFRVFQATGQILDHIGNSDGLALGIHPAWGEHDPQVTAKGPDHFKRGPA
ncbi:MAG: hypothetical protein WBB23_01080 [Desulforhopalus sp.]